MRRVALMFPLVVILGGAWVATATARPVASASVKPTQLVARMLGPHEVFTNPTRDWLPFMLVRARRPITLEQTTLPVIGRRTDARGVRWLHVKLPGRPNGHAGWIQRGRTNVSTTDWHIVVDLSLRRVIVYRNGRAVRSASAIVGKPSTPTPRGQFFVEESVELRASDAGAPFALALSADSNVLQEFDGGPGQIALHGLENIGGTLGSAVSHGCVRLDSATMRWLVSRIGPGVPVTIRS